MRVDSLKRVGLCWLGRSRADRVAATRADASQAVSTSCHCNQNFCPPSGSDAHLQIRRAPRSAATWVDLIVTSLCFIITLGPQQNGWHSTDNIFKCKISNEICLIDIYLIKICFSWWNCWLTKCGLVMPYDDKALGQHWFRWWLLAWRHQDITWTNVDLSTVKFYDIHLRAL